MAHARRPDVIQRPAYGDSYGTIEVELQDTWHPPGFRMKVPRTPDGGPPKFIEVWHVTDTTQKPDPATMHREGDRQTGTYNRVEPAADGCPRYRFEAVAGWTTEGGAG